MAQETMARPQSESSDRRFVGKPVPRADATAKVTGKTVYADDMHLPRMLHAKILGAPFAHAKGVRGRRVRVKRIVGSRLSAREASQAQHNLVILPRGTPNGL